MDGELNAGGGSGTSSRPHGGATRSKIFCFILERRSKKHLSPRISSSLLSNGREMKQEDTEEGDMLCRNWSR